MALFHPAFFRHRITDITVADLQKYDIKGLLLDVDNTLTKHGSQELAPDVRAWLDTMRNAGVRLTVVSNSWNRRVEPFADKIGLAYTAFSCKPLPTAFFRGVRRLGLPKKNCAAVGDQLFTDVLGSRLYGIPCILLEPIELETGKPFTLLKRKVEKLLLKGKCFDHE